MIKALIWDVDGTLSETEETHRAAFNQAFAEARLDWSWDQETYRRLLQVTGGKERMARFAADREMAIETHAVAEIHKLKTAIYGRMIENGSASLRPGVREVIETARQRGFRNAIATTTSRPNIDALIVSTLGRPADQIFDAIAAGDEVAAKKPAPDVYLLALRRLGLSASDCIAIEDSMPGLAAARAAGLRVLVTPSIYTDGDDFGAADWMISDLTAPLPDPLTTILARA
ncbi:HAD-IA family hydrolase [Paracoccus benzoatiresistens]|uniref:HAD-IA family hydrolase n=1 Tax=Paracoccus benzoatiresistens TaxID=2997341 RepID=A0ABT4JD61_9RHOB|nr:HAD-IA family hydrolase [Paracoccus sp. EF6]MCZ0964466.1 HAD-IA family hydrolase [Paracoccus sp. EF6]